MDSARVRFGLLAVNPLEADEVVRGRVHVGDCALERELALK